MQGRDPHTALRSQVIKTIDAGRLEISLAELQWGREDKGYNLHVNPKSFSNFGLQPTDLLSYLGFERNDLCSFTTFQRCYSKWVTEDFRVEEFATAFNSGFGYLDRAQSAMQACGFALPQPEGWGYYYGGRGGRSTKGAHEIPGDGHTALKVDRIKEIDDERFQFRFSFIELVGGEGFVIHYRPKHQPVSSEIHGVFKYLGLKEFDSCPEFDFEPCFYRTLTLIPRGDDMSGGNIDHAHRAFDAHATRFSPGIEDLLAANTATEAVGMTFLPLAQPAERMRADIATKVRRPAAVIAPGAGRRQAKPSVTAEIPESFDVAISFAGTEREYARTLSEAVRNAGYSVFYDDFYPEQLWGKNLAIFFDEIFRKKARFCVIFVSKEYQDRKWTSHEARSAQARAMEEKGNEYILPIRVDGTELEGLLPTIGYVPIETGIEKIGETLVKKLNLGQ